MVARLPEEVHSVNVIHSRMVPKLWQGEHRLRFGCSLTTNSRSGGSNVHSIAAELTEMAQISVDFRG